MSHYPWVDVVISLLVVIGIFLICREIVCWYWKLNEIVRILRRMDASLSRIAPGFEVVGESGFDPYESKPKPNQDPPPLKNRY